MSTFHWAFGGSADSWADLQRSVAHRSPDDVADLETWRRRAIEAEALHVETMRRWEAVRAEAIAQRDSLEREVALARSVGRFLEQADVVGWLSRIANDVPTTDEGVWAWRFARAIHFGRHLPNEPSDG